MSDQPVNGFATSRVSSLRMAALSKIISALVLLAVAALAAVRFGLVSEDLNPFSPLSLGNPQQWFVDFKLAALRDDAQLCRTVLNQRYVDTAPVSDKPLREGCGWSNSVAVSRVGDAKMTVSPLTCEMTAATALWVIQDVQPLARATLGSGLARIHTMGAIVAATSQAATGAVSTQKRTPSTSPASHSRTVAPSRSAAIGTATDRKPSF